MNRQLFFVMSFALATACARNASQAAAPTPPCPAHEAPTLGGAPVRPLEIPAPGAGQPREVKVLVDEPVLKLVMIVLRQGTVLPEHHSEFPVTIEAIHGSGLITAGGQQLRLDAMHPIVLAANVPHAITPESGTDMVLLVHHLRGGQPQRGGGEHHHAHGAAEH